MNEWRRIRAITKAAAEGCFSISQEQEEEIRRMLKPRLQYIGLTGHIGSGKDYVANFLAQNIERKCEVVKFATKLTEIVAAILGVDDLSLFQNREWKELKQFVWNRGAFNTHLISARDVQKMIGTDIMRNLVDDNIWVDTFGKHHKDPDTLYIISDLRFDNEMQFVQKNDGIVVFIENNTAATQQYLNEMNSEGYWTPHNSEALTWSLFINTKPVDYRLDNNEYNNPQPLQDLLQYIKEQL